MNTKININDPAYPTIEQGGNLENWNTIAGLTIRQQFAMAAMTGYITAEHERIHENIAKDAVLMADALIAALNKEVPSE